MLTKIVKIIGIGKFENFSPPSSVELAKVTLVYSNNGRGKTTTSSILRSAKTGDANIIIGRKTLNCTSIPEVKMELNGKPLTFDGTKWDGDGSCMEIFDANFIEKNICSGAQVLHDHRKNLYSFMVGDKGVALTQRIAILDDQTRELSQKIGEMERQITKKIIAGMDIEKFLTLPIVVNVGGEITIVEKEISALKIAKSIETKLAFSKVELPSLPPGLSAALSKTLEDVSQQAEENTKNHIAACMDEHGEAWINRGLGYILQSDECPFCKQPLSGSLIISAYRDYFSEEYRNLKAEIEGWKQTISSLLSQSLLNKITLALEGNSRLDDFWQPIISRALPNVDTSTLEDAWNILSILLLAHIDRKISSPLESINYDASLSAALSTYATQVQIIAQYNKTVDELNELIQAKKKEVSAGSLQAAQEKLVLLQNSKERHLPQMIKQCDELIELRNKKQKALLDKEKAKDDLEAYTSGFLEIYGDGINKYLDEFGVDYRVSVPRKSLLGGKASVSYCLKINGVEVPVAEANDDANANFGNTLSGGDKTTLALAFFLARLDHEVMVDKIIIFDDPISSLDFFRKNQTHHLILDIAKKAKQTIVLSHDKHFLRLIAQGCKGPLLKDQHIHLQLADTAGNSEFIKWDAISDSLAQEHKDLKRLSDYLRNGASSDAEMRDIARCIRPLVEAHLKMTYIDELTGKNMLGDIINVIETSGATLAINKLNPYLQSLKMINTYSSPYMHGESPTANSEPIDDLALKHHVKMALKFLSDFYQIVST